MSFKFSIGMECQTQFTGRNEEGGGGGWGGGVRNSHLQAFTYKFKEKLI